MLRGTMAKHDETVLSPLHEYIKNVNVSNFQNMNFLMLILCNIPMPTIEVIIEVPP
jgi:hypothetical protein